METHLKQEIMLQSRHQFIYGYNGLKRELLLRSLETDYPIAFNQDSPMAIYLEDYALPMINNASDNKNNPRLSLISREYLSFTIISAIIERIITSINLSDEQAQRIIKSVNNYMRYEHISFSSLEELLKELKESQNFYRQYYTNIMLGDSSFLDIERLRIQFLELNGILENIKEGLCNSSYFGVIIDQQIEIPEVSKKAVNDIVSMRINGDLSMKIACKPDEWECNNGLSGMAIDSIHDYGTVELDDSNKQYVLELKKKYFKE